LLERGIEPTLSSFFSQQYLERLYSGHSTVAPTVAAYVRRVGRLMRARDYDFTWLEKEALPWFPWIIERAMLPQAVPLIVDYDDAVFHRYDLHESGAIRRLLGGKLDTLMKSASLVTAGNTYLANRASAAGARRVEIVPTVVDLAAYTQRTESLFPMGARIGWIGTPSTWAEYVAPMMQVLTQSAESAMARIVAVGAGLAAERHPLLDNLPWTEDSEVARIQSMDIGIMPLMDTPWARGKCGYKIIQYMACGVPVIASPVGVNAEIVEHGVNGFLASTDAEWAEALQILLRNPELRARMGNEGRRKIERDYSLQEWGPRVAQLLVSVAEERK
jgi:hypothetical protein